MYKEKNICPICENKCTYQNTYGEDVEKIECPVCGNYLITKSFFASIQNGKKIPKEKLSFAIRQKFDKDEEVKLDNENWEEIVKNCNYPEKISDKAMLILKHFYNSKNQIGYQQRFMFGITNRKQYDQVMNYIKSSRYITGKPLLTSNYIVSIKLSQEGIDYIENELLPVNHNSETIFVAMWFDEEMKSIYQNAIKPAIESTGYKALRIDEKEHNGKICDKIIEEIKKSKAVIADFTGHRGGVYYEAGFAHGLNLPVIFSVRDDDINNLHFDVRQYSTIAWNNENNLFQRLVKRINETVK